MKIIKPLILAILIASQYAQAQDINPFINDPALSPSGESLAFSYQGDIWTSDIDGSNTNRVTIHEGYESYPLWSKDGSQIVFQSDRNGNSDLFVVSAEGGLPKQLTYHSKGDYLSDVTKEGQVIFQSARNYRQIERGENEIQSVAITGGTPTRVLDALGNDATRSPSGRYFAFTRGICRTSREAYSGPANRDIWLFDTQTEQYIPITNHQSQDFAPQWGENDETLYFLSARSGRYNIHQLVIESADANKYTINQLTTFEQMGISSFQVGHVRQTIILNMGNQVYLLDVSNKELKEVKIKVNTDYRFDPMVRKSYSGDIRNISPSPNGAYSAIEIRGEIFIIENDKEKNKAVNVSKSSYRDREPQWVNDSTLVFISDRQGQNNLYAVQSTDSMQPDLFKSLKHQVTKVTSSSQTENNILISPNGKSIAFERGSGQLITADISPKGLVTAEKTLLNGWASPNSISWSPDSKWLAYGLTDLNFNDEIFIHKADNSMAAVNISMHPKADYDPVWSNDGSKLVFSSDRSNGDHDIWFLWLRKSDWEKTNEEWIYDDEPAKGESIAIQGSKKKNKSSDDDSEDEPEVKDIEIDLENIHERLEQVTSFAGNEVNPLISKDGKTIYYSTTGLGWGRSSEVDKDIFKISWDGKDHKSVTSGNSRPGMMIMDAKHEYIYTLLKGGKANRIKLASDKKENLPVSANLIIDYKEELNQIFEEAWNAVNENFYDPNFHGQSFDQLKEIYKPLALSASTREDFNTIFNRMLGQLNASHMGLYRGDMRKSVQKNATGLLGVEVIPHANGVEVISKLDYMPADREISQINIGDIITAVNGITVSADKNFFELMNHTAKERTLLNITSKSGVSRELEIRPVSSNRDATYQAWIKEKQALVNEWSNGQLGYIHIQAMGWKSFERFERELSAAGYGNKGIVIDVRYNGGGWTTDHLMAVLNVEQHAYTIPRGATESLANNPDFKENYPYSERLPLPAWTKPSIALCNEASYSNAEIFSHAYKNLNIGTLVGQPTFGAVISTGGKGLIDGSLVRLPFRAWYAKQTGENMELGPAVPDILVENAPDEKGKKQDSQLKRAVEELLQQMKE